jgi:hypothetical protein
MRIAVFVLGILGSLAAGTLGGIWLKDTLGPAGQMVEILRQVGPTDEAGLEKLREWDRLGHTIWFLLAALPLGIFGSILALRGNGVLGALLMVLAALGPVILFPKTLLFTSILLLAGVLSLLVRRPRAPESSDAFSAVPVG